MRNRGHFIGLWLSESEYQYLQRQCYASGLTASAFVRKSIQGEKIRPRPPETYAALLRELAAIGNNLNQIAHWANAAEGISKADVQTAISLIEQTFRLAKDTL